MAFSRLYPGISRVGRILAPSLFDAITGRYQTAWIMVSVNEFGSSPVFFGHVFALTVALYAQLYYYISIL